MDNLYRFDGQVHVWDPKNLGKRLDDVLTSAAKSRLDAIALLDHGSTIVYDAVSRGDLLHSKWTRYGQTPTQISIRDPDGQITLLRGEEIASNQGHLLAWGIAEEISPQSQEAEAIMENVFSQGGSISFAHPCSEVYRGVSSEDIARLADRFYGEPMALDLNGQMPSYWPSIKEAELLSREYGLPLMGSSDLHCRVPWEHLLLGRVKYSTLPRELVDVEDLGGSLARILKDPVLKHSARSEGTTSSLARIAGWNIYCALVDVYKRETLARRAKKALRLLR